MLEWNIGNEIKSNTHNEFEHNGHNDNEFIVRDDQSEEAEGSSSEESDWLMTDTKQDKSTNPSDTFVISDNESHKNDQCTTLQTGKLVRTTEQKSSSLVTISHIRMINTPH